MRLPIFLIVALLIAIDLGALAHEADTHLPLVMGGPSTSTAEAIETPAPTVSATPTATSTIPCTPMPLNVTSVGTRLQRSDLPSRYDAVQQSVQERQVDGVLLSSHVEVEFTGDFRQGPALIRNEVAVYCTASIAADNWSRVVDEVKSELPILEEHQLEIGEQTYAFSQSRRGAILYGLLFRQDNVNALVYITGYEDVIDLETIESLVDIIEAKLE